MDGKDCASSILRSLRVRNGLTQRALAHRAGVPQPTIAAIEARRREPSITLLSRIAESVGETLETRLVPLDRRSVLAAGVQIADLLSGRRHPERPEKVREDGCLRVVLDLRDGLRRAGREDLLSRVAAPPSLTGEARWDALLAAVVEDECARKNVAPPRWTSDPRRFTKPFWYLSKVPTLHDWELANAPGAFVRHGVLAAEEELESV